MELMGLMGLMGLILGKTNHHKVNNWGVHFFKRQSLTETRTLMLPSLPSMKTR